MSDNKNILDENVELDSLEDLEDLDNFIVLNDEDGNEMRFEFLDLIEYENNEYVVLLPDDDEAEEVVILRLEEESGENETYSTVESQEILDAVFAIFKEKFKEEFNFQD